jgi:hypothetical protein
MILLFLFSLASQTFKGKPSATQEVAKATEGIELKNPNNFGPITPDIFGLMNPAFARQHVHRAHFLWEFQENTQTISADHEPHSDFPVRKFTAISIGVVVILVLLIIIGWVTFKTARKKTETDEEKSQFLYHTSPNQDGSSRPFQA